MYRNNKLVTCDIYYIDHKFVKKRRLSIFRENIPIILIIHRQKLLFK